MTYTEKHRKLEIARYLLDVNDFKQIANEVGVAHTYIAQIVKHEKYDQANVTPTILEHAKRKGRNTKTILNRLLRGLE